MDNQRQHDKPPVAAIFVHAGAGYHSSVNEKAHLQACSDAARAAMRFLQSGADATVAVEVAIRCLEDTEITNAGYGSNLNMNGVVEGDATVVDHLGRSGACGAVPAIQNPISLAKIILDASIQPLSLCRVPPNILVGAGALKFAREHGMPAVPNEMLVSRNAKERFIRWFKDLKDAETLSNQAPMPEYCPYPGSDSGNVYGQFGSAFPVSKPDDESLAGTQKRCPSLRTNSRILDLWDPNDITRAQMPFINAPWIGNMQTSGYTDRSVPVNEAIPSQQVHSPADADETQRHDISLPIIPPSDDGDSRPKPGKPASTLASGVPSDIGSQVDGEIRNSACIPRGPEDESGDVDMVNDTVGAIAIDLRGRIAAGSSSGGIGMKHEGRVGPAALAGIGTAVIPADPGDEDAVSVAAVTSGTGEHMATSFAALQCAQRLYHGRRRGLGGQDVEEVDEDAIVESFVARDFMGHPGVENQPTSGAIGVAAVKQTNYGYYFYFAHNTDSFALASMASTESEPLCTMSRVGATRHGVVRGGRKIHTG